ncbi:MAG: PDZ domain-containing protein [Proteobacteria bacterium]|nr:PDZ domain-containing protein [Pseudomonadota bacterium]
MTNSNMVTDDHEKNKNSSVDLSRDKNSGDISTELDDQGDVSVVHRHQVKPSWFESKCGFPFPTKSLVFVFLFCYLTSLVVSLIFVVFVIPFHSSSSKLSVATINQRTAGSLSLGQIRVLSVKDLDPILERNLFNQAGELGDTEKPVEEGEEEYFGDIKKTRLPFRLVGTFYGGDPYSGVALIEDTTTKTVNSFSAGNLLQQFVSVYQILHKKVIIDHQGEFEYLAQEEKELVRRKRASNSYSQTRAAVSKRLPQNSQGRILEFKEEGYEYSDGKIFMTESYKKKLLTQDFSKVLQDAKADPYLVGNKLAGFKLTRIRKDSIYEKAGFADGDIVTEINGIELTSVSQAISVLQAARNANKLEVTVIQNGTAQSIAVTIGQ